MKIKKITPLLVGSVGLVALASCGPKPSDVEPGATVITMYAQSFEDWSNEHLEQLRKSFNSIMDDGIQLEIKLFEDGVYNDALISARENNKAPDIFMTSYGNLYHDVIEPEYGAPLDDLMGADAINDIVDNVKDMVQFKNKTYAYPQLVEPSSLFFYRKSVLAKAGVTSVPKTWDELYDACAKIKPTLRKGQYVLGMPQGMALGWATYGMQINATGGLAVNEKWDQCLVDSDGYRDLNGFFYDVYAGGYCPAGQVSTKGYNDIIQGLCEDKLAMTFAGSWSMADVIDLYPDIYEDIGVAIAPTKTGDENKCTATNGGWTYSISSSSQNKEKAATVLKYLLCDDAARTAEFFEKACYGKAAVTKSVQAYLSSHVTDKYKDFLDIVTSVSNTAQEEPRYVWAISTSVSQMFETMAVRCDANKGETYRTSLINDAVTKCVQDINGIIASPDYKTNPYIEG